MKLPTIAKFRILILFALAVCEVIGLLHFYGQPAIFRFIGFSTAVIMLVFPLLWLDIMGCIDVNYLEFISTPLLIVAISIPLKNEVNGFEIVWAIFYCAGIAMFLSRVYVTFRKYKLSEGGRA